MRTFVIFELPFRGRDEFLPLAGNPCLDVTWVKPQHYRGGADVIILPGSGRTMSDLVYLRENGGDRLIREHLSGGGTVVGVCGGYQMLGEMLYDPFLKQGEHAELPGLGLLPTQTTFGPTMMQSRTTALLASGKCKGASVSGLEIRSGFTQVKTCVEPGEYLTLLDIAERDFQKPKPESAVVVLKDAQVEWCPGDEKVDGLVSRDRKVWGTYLHLIFHNDPFVRSFLATLP